MATGLIGEYVRCNLCGADNTKLIFFAKARSNNGEIFRIVKCKACGLAYLNPRPDNNEIKKYYPPEYWSRIHSHVNIEDTMIWGVPWNQAIRMKAEPILKHKKGGSLLDIGCGDGSLLKFLKDIGWEVHGVELGKESSRFAREELGLDVFSGRLEETDYPVQSFDVVSLIHSLEHLPDPSGTLRKIHSILKQDGILVVEVPNFGGFGSLLFRSNWVGIQPPLHMYYFTPSTLEKMLKICGLVPIEFRFISGRTKYIYEYSESLRYCLANWGLYPFRRKAARQQGLGEDNVKWESNPSSWKSVFHQIEYRVFSSLGYCMDKIGLGANLIIIAKKEN